MKKAVKILGIVTTAFITIFYLLSSFASYIPPEKMPIASVFSLAYLPLLVLYVLTIVTLCFLHRRVALLLIVLLFCGYKNLTATVGFNVLHASWKEQKDSNSLRIMCWNVNFMGDQWIKSDTPGNPRRQMLDFIKTVQPDILCIQDFSTIEEGYVTNTFLNNVNDLYSYGNFKNYHFAYYNEWNGDNYCVKVGSAIFSKYPIVDTGTFNIEGQKAGEGAAYADLLLNNKRFRIFAAHLSSMALWPNTEGEAGIHYLEGDSTKKRTKTILSKLSNYGRSHAHEAAIIKKEMNKSPYPYLLSADLNSVPSGYVYHSLRAGLKDAFLENDFGIGGTYHLLFPKLRIDVLLHSKEIEVTQYKRPAVNLSDHYPIIADIRWKK